MNTRNNQGTTKDQPSKQAKTGFAPKFSLKAVFVLMVVFSVSAMTVGYLVRSINDPIELGYFVVITSMAPLAVMVATSWAFRLFQKFFQ